MANKANPTGGSNQGQTDQRRGGGYMAPKAGPRGRTATSKGRLTGSGNSNDPDALVRRASGGGTRRG